jgi:hypothetical protein
MATIDELRTDAKEHARQLEAVHWLGVSDLAARWGVSTVTVRKIDRALLPYLPFGASRVRRYDPRDIEKYEAEQKQPAPANTSAAGEHAA